MDQEDGLCGTSISRIVSGICQAA